MGIYLNPNANAFMMGVNSSIYVDKSLVIEELNKLVGSMQNFVCISRPRRFGKSMAGNLISAYYSKGCDTREIFSKMKIGEVEGYDKYLNKFNVLKLDIAGWYQRSIQERRNADLMSYIQECLLSEFKNEFPNVSFLEGGSLAYAIQKVYEKTGEQFVIIIDEYDVLVREQVPETLFEDYLSFLNSLFKDSDLRPAIALAYLTGILPIVREKIQSKLNEFHEYSMIRPVQFAGMIGFTGDEVFALCDQYGIDKEECKRWYDGYRLSESFDIYNPLSVIKAIQCQEFDNYWTSTSSFEALKNYILMDFEGIRQDVVSMISGSSVEVDVNGYLNTLNCFRSKDDVFTYLIHLGYLSYNRKDKTCKIPNEEVRHEWIQSVKLSPDYKKLMDIVTNSKRLLDATVNGNEDAVATALDAAHAEVTNPLTYNDEHCFQSAIRLAYFYANTRYTICQEMPTGKGYADIVFIPYIPNIPALVVELKCNKNAESAIQQIKDRNYGQALNAYKGDLLFVGVNYDQTTKKHSCKIEKLTAN